MMNFLKETWIEYIDLIQKYIPQSTLDKLKKNKRKYLSLLFIAIAIEVTVAYLYFTNETNKTEDNNLTIERSNNG